MIKINSSKSQESSQAIERIYIAMRHLFNRGFYKPMGVSGETLREALLTLKPEIYGSIGGSKAELDGLHYIIDRLPEGITACRFINLTSEEGFSTSHFKPIIPYKRRRNCYRIDKNQMNIEITRGRSDVYDILTHLTFLYIESEKIAKKVLLNKTGKVIREWTFLEDIVVQNKKIDLHQKEVVFSYLSTILGRSFNEVKKAYDNFSTPNTPNRFFEIIYWMGCLSIEELVSDKKRIITFTPLLRERIGQHISGDKWATKIKKTLVEKKLHQRPIHIISANMHSVMNSLYGELALVNEKKKHTGMALFELLSQDKNEALRKKVKNVAAKNGLTYIKDNTGTNINVQIIDTAKINLMQTVFHSPQVEKIAQPVLVVMDYAFGEQAYETMDELLKPLKTEGIKSIYFDVASISIMGKAGVLQGSKGTIMIPKAHIFEGTADNYPFKNRLKPRDFEGSSLDVCKGSMVTVLGTSLQNKDLLEFFKNSTWQVIGLEMEGAHYQKAIQAASKIRGNISKKVKVRYAYYASDNPLKTGSTLASGGLGTNGVKPTYTITEKILKQILLSE